jgi:hypothetical protein
MRTPNEFKSDGRIILPCGRVVRVSPADLPLVRPFRWRWNGHYVISAPQKNRIRKTILIHRVILGVTDRSITVDHRDLDTLNNRRSNLRLASQSQQMANSRKPNRLNSLSKYKGVSWRKRRKRWQASIMVQGRKIHLGFYTTESEAARQYDQAAYQYFGEFARLNFPKEGGV